MPRTSADGESALDARRSTLDPIRLNRLRWRCRRGMLENDLILERFLDARGESLTEAEVASLDRLLDFADGELWDLLSGRAQPEDTALRSLLSALRRRSDRSMHETSCP